MTAFAAAIDVIFADPHVAANAVWTTAATSEVIPVRVIRKSPDVLQGFGGAQFQSESNMFDLRKSEIDAPAKGDTFVVGMARYVVQSEPMLDRLQLVWTLDVRPIA
ncbi:head-tail joining protein [Loktanella sp. M215]|uniref:head-tail joining protein n=1 Tax=Loktanella sp. M215 TaxID=2675431 RepID=UPI001F33532B|nr:hypothetical protein [Loktanella sp. M215]MCF7700548.1 hypothetical protein [Loktanella sp. M215]